MHTYICTENNIQSCTDSEKYHFTVPGMPYGTYMSHVFFLHLLHEYNKKKYFKLSPILL